MYYYYDPRIVSGDGSKMVHGELDLLLGDSSSFSSNHIVMLTENY